MARNKYCSKDYWTDDILKQSASPFTTRISFKRGNGRAYKMSRKKGPEFMDRICSHMVSGRRVWYKENLSIEAKKYTSRWEFQKHSKGAYLTAFNMDILDDICSHMDKLCREPYNEENLKEVISKYEYIGDFKKNDQSAYKICRKLKLMDKLAGHLKRKCRIPFTDEELFVEARKHLTRSSFREITSMYSACRRRAILKEACSHMKRTGSIGSQESLIFNKLFYYFTEIIRYRDYKVKINDKPYIKGFEIDMLIPSLRKGIEFDGKHYHSFEFMRSQKGKSIWSDDDIRNYHQIKDSYFLSTHGIQILHIKEEEWINNKNKCIRDIEEFLDITGFMAELDKKVA